mgnify:CR=1 FL=1
MRRVFLTIAFLLLSPTAPPSAAIDETAPLVTLHIRHLAPDHVAYRIAIFPHRDNVWFCMGWDNTTTLKSRTSCQQLNGIYSPRIVYQEYKGLAEGCYRGFVDVYHAPHYRAATATYQFRIGYIPCA